MIKESMLAQCDSILFLGYSDILHKAGFRAVSCYLHDRQARYSCPVSIGSKTSSGCMAGYHVALLMGNLMLNSPRCLNHRDKVSDSCLTAQLFNTLLVL